MAIEKTIIVRTDTSEAVKGVDKLNESIKETNKDVKQTSETTKVLGGELDKATNGAIGKFKGLVSVVKTTIKGFKGLQVAIAATGLGLLLITLASLKAAFTGSEEGQNKFAKILGVIGALTGNLVDLLADLGDAIISVFENPKKAIQDFADLVKNTITNQLVGLTQLIPNLGKAVNALFRGDFGEAGKIATDAVGKVAFGVDSVTESLKNATQATKDFIKEQEREAGLAADVADKRAKADILARELVVERADLENKIAQLRLKSREEEKFSAKERKQALIEAQELEDQLLKKETEVLELRSDAIKLENTFSRSNKENLDAEAQAIAEVTRQQAKRTNAQRATQRELNTLNKKIASEAKARAKEEEDRVNKEIADTEKRLQTIADLKKKFLDADADLDAVTREQKLALEKERAQQDLNNLIGTETEKREAQLALNALYDQKELDLKTIVDEENKLKKEEQDKKEIQDAQTVATAKAAIRDAELNNISSGINLVKGLFEKNKALQAGAVIAENAVGVAKTIINTQAANAAALVKYAAIPGGQALSAAEISANNVSSGLSIAASVAATAKALGTLGKGGGSSGGSAPSGGDGGSAPTPPPAFNLVGGSGVNQISDSLSEEQTPIQAFVVGSEVTNQQEIDNAQASSASLG
jgi:hypothetical protein